MSTGKEGSRIDWVKAGCHLLTGIEAEFARTKPFRDMTIGTGIHLEPKTAILLRTLHAGGARIVATGNLNSTQPDTVDYLHQHGIEVIAEQTMDQSVHDLSLNRVIAEKPDLILDNGGDLFAIYAEAPYPELLGGTEETTSGRMRLAPMREQLQRPILVINDSPIKQFAENRHAVGQSMFESYMRLTNRSTNGKRVTVFGYGACGRGVAANFRNASANVSVVDADPVTTLEAHFDGFLTPPRDHAIRTADVIVTETGAVNVITADDLGAMKDGAVLMNGGHFPTEIAVSDLLHSPQVVARDRFEEQDIETLHLKGGRTVHILAGGHMANLAGPRPLGNSIESMDLGFALQARCLEHIASGKASKDDCVVPVPPAIDAEIAEAYLDRHR
ncbi:adenosylhomocysteinase [Hoeflea prorocentri]|uniref:Adenosylhomocysteinase n=1 Tax=Hoeflea prorocentri TaxID=1922333 RepID=A0A9X3UDX5_9HYPH|nr:adenosylhomocysteinase [Hoeflea prorocentri]MCY6379517.1 adenosylhomocysteinase [Hoeflea prorocentri]MDA5397317.1 adenosylhomocysteinase [Hoeflea prorocentri]